MKKINLPECPVATFLMLVDNKWRILIIRDLLCGTKRFGELQRSIGCSQKVLTDNLRELEGYGLVSRNVYPEVPPRVEYSMTKLGATLSPILDDIAKWGMNYKKVIK
jgi:DNA-binding HxlR family transcriptional regulator